MNDFKRITQIVKAVLEQEPQARNSDDFLYTEVLDIVGESKGVNALEMTVREFLRCRSKLGLPGFETVRRTRQKKQRENPELAACEKVNVMRIENEKEFRHFAKRMML